MTEPKWIIERNSIGKPIGWYTQECLAVEKALAARLHNDMWYTIINGGMELHKARAILNRDNRKLAYIIVGKTQKMAWVDNETMKAYKADGYAMTWMEWKHFKFDRWLTSMDL